MSTPATDIRAPEAPRGRAVLLPLALVWLVCTAINVGKAAHIDDTAHLEIARWIAEHPLHPMQGVVQWSDRPAPIHTLNQPHLFFYLLAAVRLVFGPSLAAAQLLLSVFVALGIAAFHGLWRTVIGARGEVLGPALLFLGPAFIPGQNVMTDAPLLALWLAFAFFVVRARGEQTTRFLALAALVAGVACLLKYTSVVLLPLLALDVWLRGPAHRRALGVLAIPLVILAAWSAFNLADYGGIHLLERPLEVGRFTALEAVGITAGRAALWLVTLGGVVPFALALAPRLRAHPRALGAALVAITVLTIATQLVAANGPDAMRGETIAHSAARALFFVVGLAVLALALRSRPTDLAPDDARAMTFFRAWLTAGALFVIVLSPFVAVRHVLLVLPPLMLLVARTRIDVLADPKSRAWLHAGAALTIALGVLLGISDRRWADTYRAAATRHRSDAARGVRTVFVGHWGWQWHAMEAGLVPYAPGVTELGGGDCIVRPRLVDQPPLAPSDRARLVLRREDAVPAGALDVLRTTTDRLGYYSVWQGLPWTISVAPVEVFEVYDVQSSSRE